MQFRFTHLLSVAAVAAMSLASRPALAQGTFTMENPDPQTSGCQSTTNGVSAGCSATDGYLYSTSSTASAAFGNSNLGCNVTPGGSKCGFNGNATSFSLFSATTGTTFTLNSGYFMALPSNAGGSLSATSVLVTGYGTGGNQIFQQTISLTGSPVLTTFNQQNLNNVVFTPQVAGSSISYFLVDDIVVNNAVSVPTPSTAPEPSSLALLGTGLVGLVPAVRRRIR